MTESDDRSAEVTSVFASGLIPGGRHREDGRDDAPHDTGGDADAEVPLAGAEALPDGTALLVVKRGANAGSRFRLEADVITAGRHPDSDVFLDDVSVSRWHAQFRRANAGFEVVDVGSLNGTYVNREPIDSSLLAGGDEVQIGKFRLVYLTGPAARGDAAATAGTEGAS